MADGQDDRLLFDLAVALALLREAVRTAQEAVEAIQAERELRIGAGRAAG